jgi:hypothetical protein
MELTIVILWELRIEISSQKTYFLTNNLTLRLQILVLLDQ